MTPTQMFQVMFLILAFWLGQKIYTDTHDAKCEQTKVILKDGRTGSVKVCF